MTESRESYFWATHAGAELDLLVPAGGKRYGFEFKYADVPRRSKSMLVAIQDLGLDRIWVVYPCELSRALKKRMCEPFFA